MSHKNVLSSRYCKMKNFKKWWSSYSSLILCCGHWCKNGHVTYISPREPDLGVLAEYFSERFISSAGLAKKMNIIWNYLGLSPSPFSGRQATCCVNSELILKKTEHDWHSPLMTCTYARVHTYARVRKQTLEISVETLNLMWVICFHIYQ